MHKRCIAFDAVVMCLMCACTTHEPTLVINGCLAPAMENVQKTAQATDVRCDFQGETTLVAVPASMPSQGEVEAAGLAKDAAATLVSVQTPGHKWCTIEKHEAEVSGVKPGWEVKCVATRAQMERMTIVTAKSFKIALGPASNGVRLIDLQRAE
jgi:hypothetical protein